MTQPSPEFLELQAALAGEYSLQRELGRGGMGIVHLAREVQLDRDVAIKVLPSHLAQVAESRERFLREARTAAGLSHPHIVPIHRVGEAGGFVFFVMAYVEGETLGERLRRGGPLAPADAARIMREVAWALAYAHGRGIVHRDVKPDNILLEAGTDRALVTDFGIAAGADSTHDTDPGRIMGTAHFMSPEQAANAPIDGRSDLYALGVVGYLAVSGRLPFEAPSVPALLIRQATEAPASVTRVAPGLPPALATVIDRCLVREPAGRFPDGEALAAALAPAPDARPPLPPTLRAWLAARNPLLVPYLGWSGLFAVLSAGNLYALLTHNPGSTVGDVATLVSLASAPLVPIVGFHLNQARRQFRAGHTLADLRTALAVARRERAETEALALDEQEAITHRLLRLATVGAATWLGVTFVLLLLGTIHENRIALPWMLVPMLSTLGLGAASNALGV
ncbi:MAG TPA: serine/threonine-protein kinase, partial [Gemmatimonadaceae bacterium]|nr:serine/threonine-protein kinase [Gemmatimonadaceae bacterium]